MPSKYSHSVVLAGYSSRGIIGPPNDERLDNQRALKTPRILPGRPPPHHDSVFMVKPGTGPSSRSSYHARSTTSQPTLPAQRLSAGQCGTFTGGRHPKDEVFNHVRLKGRTEGVRPSTRERKVILDSESEETASGIAHDHSRPRTSGPADGKPRISYRLSSPFDPYVESLDLALQQDPPRAETNQEIDTNSRNMERNKKLLSPVAAAQKHESGRGFRDAAPRSGRNALPSHRRPRSRQHGDAEPLISTRHLHTSSPRAVAMEDAGHPKRNLISTELAQHNDLHQASMPKAVDQISKPQKPRRPSLSRANTSFIDLSDDEMSAKSRGHTPHTSLGKSPSTQTLISEIGVQDSSLWNLADDLLALRSELISGTRRKAQEKLGNAAIWNDGLTKAKVRRRPVSQGGGHPETRPLQKRASLCRRQTEELTRQSVSRSPVLESHSLSWLLLDVGSNEPMKDDCYDEAQIIPHITLQLPKSETRAEVTNEPDEAEFSKHTDGNESESSSGRGEDLLWSPTSAKSAPTSLESDGRQAGFSHFISCSIEPEPQTQTDPESKSLASSGTLKLMPRLKSEEEMRMKIPTPIPSPSLSASSPKISGKRMVRSSSGSLHQASRPATMPEFGTPSVVRYDDQTNDIHGKCASRPGSRLSSGTLQKQKFGSETLRKLASFSRFPRLADTLHQDKDAASAGGMETHQQDDDNWVLPNIPISKEAASRASVLESMAASVEAESRLEHSAPNPWHKNPSDRGRHFQNVARQTEHGGGDLVDKISLFSNDNLIPIDVQDDYANGVHAGAEIEDPDSALPPPDISRHRADRSSSRNEQYRLSQSSLTALPRITNTRRSMNRLSWAKREDATNPTFWPFKSNPSAPLSTRPDFPKEKAEKGLRMRVGMRALWGRLRRCIES